MGERDRGLKWRRWGRRERAGGGKLPQMSWQIEFSPLPPFPISAPYDVHFYILKSCMLLLLLLLQVLVGATAALLAKGAAIGLGDVAVGFEGRRSVSIISVLCMLSVMLCVCYSWNLIGVKPFPLFLSLALSLSLSPFYPFLSLVYPLRFWSSTGTKLPVVPSTLRLIFFLLFF